jgi:N-acetylmuramoyl-L-alanine amidase
MKKTAILATIFSVIVLTGAFLAMENRAVLAGNRYDPYPAEATSGTASNTSDILLSENPYDTPETSSENPPPDEDPLPPAEDPGNLRPVAEARALSFEIGRADTNYLIIPVPPALKAADITIENHYLDEEMRVVLRGADSGFYADNLILGNHRNITDGTFEKTRVGTTLKFSLDGIYEYRSIMEDDRIYVEFVPPREMYSHIIVIDPAYGGSDTGATAGELAEKDVALAVTLKLKEMLDQTDYRVYYTRLDDHNLVEEKRVSLANNTKADMLIRIEGDGADDSTEYGTTAIYNADFFIPSFGSVELANLLETEVVTSIRGKAVGIKPATANDYVISNATVPAAAIRVGYLTNAQEAILLGRDDYIEKIARGIYNARVHVYS